MAFARWMIEANPSRLFLDGLCFELYTGCARLRFCQAEGGVVPSCGQDDLL